MGKEKRTFGTGWKLQPVPQGPIWDFGRKKSGPSSGGVEPCQRGFHFPPVAIEILRRFVLLRQKIYKIKVFKALGTGFMKPPGTLGFSFPAFGGLRNRVHENRYLSIYNGTGWKLQPVPQGSLGTGFTFHPVPQALPIYRRTRRFFFFLAFTARRSQLGHPLRRSSASPPPPRPASLRARCPSRPLCAPPPPIGPARAVLGGRASSSVPAPPPRPASHADATAQRRRQRPRPPPPSIATPSSHALRPAGLTAASAAPHPSSAYGFFFLNCFIYLRILYNYFV